VHMNAAISPAAPTDTAVASMSNLTDAPFPHADPKSIYWVLQFDCQNCYTCARCDQAVNNPAASEHVSLRSICNRPQQAPSVV
jgi:hypothetical protein